MLEESLIGPRNAYLWGDEITVADYLGAIMTVGGEAIRVDYGAYSNTSRWIGSMKALRNWPKVNEAFNKYVVEPNRDKEFTLL